VYISIYRFFFPSTTQPLQIEQYEYVRYNYMFWPCKWAIIRLFTELVRRLYTRHGEYLGDEISSCIIVQGVNAGYQCFTYVCTCHL